MASIYKRGRTYYLDFRIDGRRIRKNVGTSKRIAQLALKEIEVKIAKKETGFAVKDASIAQFLAEYSRFSATAHSSSTVRRYKAVIDHFLVFLKDYPGVKRLSQLNPKHFDEYKVKRKEEYVAANTGKKMVAKTNTVNMELRTLRTILYKAVEWDCLNANPLKDIKLLRVTDAKPPRFLTEKEIELLLSNCSNALHPIFFTFLNTGMRLSELLHLEWNDVDTLRAKIRIQSKEDWHPKSGRREIPLNSSMVNLLAKLKKNNSMGSKYVFHDRNGNILKRDLREDLIRVTRKSGFPDVTKIHTLRHTFASHLVMNGVDLPTVMKLMGHADIQTTMVYAHLAADHLADAVEKLVFNKGTAKL
ncbi:tyrosine-type recombinase/integrase [bacterium]|nr:tyrosine-type recombinase/integrase [bacterium]